MKIDVRFRNLEASESLREAAVRRVHFHLSRFGREISSVNVRISDVNGPKGGVDKRCQVTVRGPRLSSVVVDELSSEVYAAVDLAFQRIGRAVGRDLERMRGGRSVLSLVRRAS